MFKTSLKAVALSLSLTAIAQAADTAATDAAAPAATPAPTVVMPAPAAPVATPFNFFGFFNTASWHDAAGHVEPGQTMAINPVDPDFWNTLVSPESHSKVHMSVTNPETYGQFMTPQFYMQMANPSVWMKWMNPSVMQTAMNQETWNYWMQPGAYMHAANPEAYAQLANMDAWGKVANTTMASYSGQGGLGDWGNMFSGFMNMAMMMPQGMAAYPQAATAAQ